MIRQAAVRGSVLKASLAVAAAASCLLATPLRKRGPRFAKVEIHSGKPGCAVDVDGTPNDQTNTRGDLSLTDVTPSDHYVHVDCPGRPAQTYFISPQPGSDMELKAQTSGSSSGADNSSLALAERNMEVRRLFREAADFRSNGQFPEAINTLRRAIEIDPENPNLHHELGMTFLMVRDWQRARVELIEAIRHDPNSADLHNGLGYALEKTGEIRPALDQFRLATRLDPTDASYRDQYFEALGLLTAQQSQNKKKHKKK